MAVPRAVNRPTVIDRDRPRAMIGKKCNGTNVCQHRQSQAGSYCDPSVICFCTLLLDFLRGFVARFWVWTGQAWNEGLDIAALHMQPR